MHESQTTSQSSTHNRGCIKPGTIHDAQRGTARWRERRIVRHPGLPIGPLSLRPLLERQGLTTSS
jgi:hypothetical protein